jgi:hypothetical protein
MIKECYDDAGSEISNGTSFLPLFCLWVSLVGNPLISLWSMDMWRATPNALHLYLSNSISSNSLVSIMPFSYLFVGKQWFSCKCYLNNHLRIQWLVVRCLLWILHHVWILATNNWLSSESPWQAGKAIERAKTIAGDAQAPSVGLRCYVSLGKWSMDHVQVDNQGESGSFFAWVICMVVFHSFSIPFFHPDLFS